MNRARALIVQRSLANQCMTRIGQQQLLLRLVAQYCIEKGPHNLFCGVALEPSRTNQHRQQTILQIQIRVNTLGPT